ncbi:MAG: cysteine--tRNA ligase [Candidatus Micrarchaeota archaeon]
MRIYNSLSKKIEEFRPIEPGKVMMYVCGLTPYDSAHIGHARTYVAFDTIKRFLMNEGYKVYHIQNITDVEDKIIKRCLESGADPVKLTTEVHDEALELFRALHIIDADAYPKVTEHLPEIISMVGKLIANGYAYETDSGVYFDVLKFKGYGRLSGQDIEQMKAGVRKDVAEGKKSHLDFALWKKSKGEILEFDSPWGKGRPGWHIECSAMSWKYVGRPLDIHGGARDLIFPHHENEIAQSEAATAEEFCKYWMHTGFLTVEHEKMSKSLGNFITLKQSLQKHSPNALRLFYLQAHYRSPLDYEEGILEAAGESVERIFNSLGLIAEILSGDKPDAKDQEFRKEGDALVEKFRSSMEDDFDTPSALAALFSLLRLANAHLGGEKLDRKQLEKLTDAVSDMLWILGLEEKKVSIEGRLGALEALLSELGVSEKPDSAEAALENIILLRDEARSKKDYAKSDMVRDRLLAMGIVLEDKGQGGIRWKLKRG